MKEIKYFKRKEKNRQKCLFFQDEDSNIKYTILPDKKEKDIKNQEISITLEEKEEEKENAFKQTTEKGKMDENEKEKLLLSLLDKTKENIDKVNEYRNKLKEMNEKQSEINTQIKNINDEIESQNIFLKKIKGLYFFLVTLLMRKNNCITEKKIENKINIGSNEINKNIKSKKTLFDFVNKYTKRRKLQH